MQIEKAIAEEQMKDARMQDVRLLLENLFEREEATVKLVLDCLYDVGSVNLINNKVGARALKGPLKWIALTVKPTFRFVALRWFKKNCPDLIVNWLRSQVDFTQQ